MNPMVTVTEAVKPKCKPEWTLYEVTPHYMFLIYCNSHNTQNCTKRIASKPGEDCEAWYFDYWKCIDKWVSTIKPITH